MPHSTCPFIVMATFLSVQPKKNPAPDTQEKKITVGTGNKCTSSNFIIRLASSSCTKTINQTNACTPRRNDRIRNAAVHPS